MQYFERHVVTMDTNDLFLQIGFCPSRVRLTYCATGDQLEWHLGMGMDAGYELDISGPTHAINTDKGIKLVRFDDKSLNLSADPTAIGMDEYYKANGIQITSDVGWLADDKLIHVEAWGLQSVIVKATHDGTTSSNTYLEDGSVDFLEFGVGRGWIVYNQTNGNYCYVDRVERPSGEKKYCRVYTATDLHGTATTAADFDTSDVCYLFPSEGVQYPLSDIGLMT